MFYSQQVLTKKGPLAKIWLAAHMQSKLTKAMVFSTDLRKAVESIISPEVPMALRLTSNLLLGVVRILHRKSKYLLQESSDAMTRLKLAFRPAPSTDLPARQATAANYNAITVQPTLDTFNDSQLELDVIPSRNAASQTAFLASDRDITIDEFAGGLVGGMMDAFALEIDIDRQDDIDANFAEPLLFTPSQNFSLQSYGSQSVRSDPSIEALRAEGSTATPRSGQTPRLSTGVTPTELQGTPQTRALSTSEVPEEPEVSRLDDRQSPVTDVDIDIPRHPAASSPQPDFGSPRMEISDAASPHERPAFTPEALREQDQQPPSTPLAPVVVAQVPRLSTNDDDLIFAEPGVTITPDAPIDRDTFQTPEVQPSEDRVASVNLSARQDEGDRENIPFESPASLPETGGSAHSEGWHPPLTPEAPESPVTVAPTRERKRKGHVLFDEGATELSVSDFRACLNDTSDLIRVPRPPSRRRIDPSTYTDVLAQPAILMAPPLRELFAESFRFEEIVASPLSEFELEGEAGNLNAQSRQIPPTVEVPTPSQREPPSEPGPIETPGAPVFEELEPEDPTLVTPISVHGRSSPPHLDGSAALGGSSLPAQQTEELTPDQRGDDATDKGLESHSAAILELETGAQIGVASSSRAAGASILETGEMEAYGVEREPPMDLMDQDNIDRITLKSVASTHAQVDQASNEEVSETTVSVRTLKMKGYIKEHLSENELNFSAKLAMEQGVTKRTACRTFYELLHLGNKKAVQLRQVGAFGDIYVKPLQPFFDRLGSDD